MLTEGRGVSIGLAVAGANVNDFKLVRETIKSIPIDRPRPTAEKPQHLCLDKGYDYDEVRRRIQRFGYTPHIRTRGEEAAAKKKKRGAKPRRWVVERTHSWYNRFRRILVRWEKKPQSYEGMLHLASAIIAYQQAGLLLG